MMKSVILTGILLLLFISKGSGLRNQFRQFMNGLKKMNHLIPGSTFKPMVSIDWQQTGDSEDGMKYAHDEVTCMFFILIQFLLLWINLYFILMALFF